MNHKGQAKLRFANLLELAGFLHFGFFFRLSPLKFKLMDDFSL